jgi:hypothetical protein
MIDYNALKYAAQAARLYMSGVSANDAIRLTKLAYEASKKCNSNT